MQKNGEGETDTLWQKIFTLQDTGKDMHMWVEVNSYHRKLDRRKRSDEENEIELNYT